MACDRSAILFEEESEDVEFEDTVRKNLMTDLDATCARLSEREHVKVYLRVRPFTKDELEKKENQVCFRFYLRNNFQN